MTTHADILLDPETPAVIVNQEGVIQDINTAFEKAFEWQRDQLKGNQLTMIIPEKLRDAHHLGFSRFLMTGQPTILDQYLDLEILCGDGRIRSARHYITADQEAGQWRFVAAIRDGGSPG
ncbi:MAG: PAS domain S-box protein [Deltaproteobacteria bacterium]|nr:PAS domain S-box protein [Deltaproteobacteria bacterium]